ncbi:hypothetical protein OIV83_004873 [Microbotryomycetes sp. JL201]|nr:hypothetical protein OIV83_004873 [Microbotryomycetes sp. JL201]
MASTPRYIELTAHYQGVYIFLAYVVSVIGAWTTIELLLKRTGGSGYYNILLLVGAGIAFGGTATFGMHFVGNQAVTLHLPAPFAGNGVPLSYDVGFTILSLVVSCVSMIIAFSVIGLRLDSKAVPDSASDHMNASEKGQADNELKLERFQDYAQPHEHQHHQVPLTAGSGDSDDAHDTKHPHEPSKRFSKILRNGSSTAAFINLPLNRKRSQPDANRVSDAQDSVDRDAHDGGDFGLRPATVSWTGIAKILGAGFICGGGIAAMHYVGQVSINSVPKVSNVAWTVFLSTLIAMIAVSVGLFLLFVWLRPRLQHRWYKRLGVSMILGVAVNVMHWVALLGTRYFIVEGQPLTVPPSSASSRHLIIALVCVVTPVCCLALLVFAVIGQQRVLRQIAARHRIVLTTAIFDQQGLLLCQLSDGLLPSAKIYPDQRGDERKTSILQLLGLRDRLSLNASSRKLTRSDPAFVAFLQTSWSWKSRQGGSVATGSNGLVSDENVDGIESASSNPALASFTGPASRTSHGGGGVEDAGLPDMDDLDAAEFDGLRRAMMGFEMAGQEIATALTGTGNLQITGVLYDNILKTGHFEVSSKAHGDSFTVTQGQMLVLTRRLRTQAEREAFIARGYTFAEPSAVARVMANAYAVPNDRMLDFVKDVHRYSRHGLSKRLDRGRLYGGALIALAGDGLQVIVDEKQHHSLPSVELATLVHRASDRQFLPATTSATCTLNSVLQAVEAFAGHALRDFEQLEAPTPQTAQVQLLVRTILQPYLRRTFSSEQMAFLERRLVFAPVLVPLTDRGGPMFGADGVAQDSYLLCLRAVIPAAIVLPGSSSLQWLPFSLFKAEADCVSRWSGLQRGQQNRAGVIESSTVGVSLSNPQPVDVFPAKDAAARRPSELSSDEAEDHSTSDGMDASRPASLPHYDPDLFIKLVKMSVQPTRRTFDLPASELRSSRI